MHEDLLQRHLELVIEANKTTNITRISSWEDGMLLHVEDSLVGLPELSAAPEGWYADIGSGAGYPEYHSLSKQGDERCLSIRWARRRLSSMVS